MSNFAQATCSYYIYKRATSRKKETDLQAKTRDNTQEQPPQSSNLHLQQNNTNIHSGELRVNTN